jgi:hypothetical protein
MKQRILTLTMIFAALAMVFTSCKNDDDPVVVSKKTVYTDDGTTVTVTDKGEGTGTMTWTADRVWILNGFVFVNAGQTLTIEPGTVIKGKPGEGENASALIVARDAQIMAEGTATNPIIFTAEADDLNGSVAVLDRGLWGGLLILGNGILNTIPNQMNIEGIPTTEPRGQYGGTNNADNSGDLRYISIRHGGTNIGADNEINGLTLGGVGSGTTIEHIEVISNNDDGYEWFGGAVECKYLISAYCKDDAFDWDQGFQGKGQFWLAVQHPTLGDRLGELDGADDPEDGTPYGGAEVYNATWIGSGLDGKKTATFRANGGGQFYNSIFANQNKGVDVEMKDGLNAESSYKRLMDGDLRFENNILFDIADGTTAKVFKLSVDEGVSTADSLTAVTNFYNYFDGTKNDLATDPGIEYPASGNFNPVPTGDVTQNLASYPGGFFDNVNYKGAFEPGAANWAEGWTLLFE